MIQPLRRFHRCAFIVLAIVLPLILYIGLAARAKTVSALAHPVTHLEKLP